MEVTSHDIADCCLYICDEVLLSTAEWRCAEELVVVVVAEAVQTVHKYITTYCVYAPFWQFYFIAHSFVLHCESLKHHQPPICCF